MFEAIAHLYPQAKIDICVKPKDVAGRIRRKLSRSLPDIGQVGGGKKRRGQRITVYTAGSTHHAEHSGADILLADEIHQLMTDNTSRALAQSWRNTRNFGFTATPEGRMDGAHAKLEMFFGPEIFRLLYPEAVELGLVVPIHVRWLPIHLTHNPALDKTGITKMRWGIWRNQDRNKMIADDVRANYPDPDTQVLILVDKVDHAVHLAQFLPEFSLCYGSMNEDKLEMYKRNHYLSENFAPTTPEVRERMRREFEAGKLKRVIATDIWATGVDFERLQVLYRADARESEIMDAQGPGRVSRLCDATGKESGEIVDCMDAFDKGFLRKSRSRKSSYKTLGWSQDWPSGRRQISHVP
jgi:superfamily II DNA or RNA helicase